MTRRFWLIYALLMLAGCDARIHVESGPAKPTTGPVKSVALQKPDDSPSCHCDQDALDWAVMDRLKEAGITEYNGTVNPLKSRDEYEQEKLRRQRLHSISGDLKDRCLRDKYTEWLDYYDRELERALTDLNSRPPKDTQSEYMAKLERLRKESEECKRDGTVPRLK